MRREKRKGRAAAGGGELAESDESDADAADDWKHHDEAQMPAHHRKRGILKRSSIDRSDRDSEPNWLLSRLKAPGARADAVVNEWLNSFSSSHPEHAVAPLLSLVVRTSGVNAVLEANDVRNADAEQIREKAEACNSSCEDALSASKKDLRKLRETFLRFWPKLIQKAEATGHLFEDAQLDHGKLDEDDAIVGGKCVASDIALLSEFVEQLSQSHVRQLRHGGTVVALELITGLVHASRSLREQSLVTDAASPNAMYMSEVPQDASIENKLKLVDNFTSALFQSVFTERFRDINPKTRAHAIRCHGTWLADAPERFLTQNTNANLKYLGWALNDRDADVRQTTLSRLTQLYSNEENLSALSDFTKRFKGRIAQMLSDCSPDVVVRACETIKTLFKQELVGEQEIKSVFDLLFDDSSNVRSAAADVLADTLQDVPSDKTKEGCLQWLLLMLRKHAGSDDRMSIVAQNMQARHSLLSDWEALLSPLSDYTSWLSAADEVTLATLVAKSASCSLPDAAVKISKRERSMLKQRHIAFTSSIVEHLPAALKRHSGYDGVVSKLAESVVYSDVRQLAENPHDHALGTLISSLTTALFEHDAAQSLRPLAQALRFCYDKTKEAPSATMQSIIANAQEKTILDVMKNLHQALDGNNLDLPIDLEPTDAHSASEHERRMPQVHYTRASLERLYHMTSQGFKPRQLHETSMNELHEQIMQVLNRFTSARNVNQRVVQLAACNVLLLLIWELKDLQDPNASQSREQAVRALQSHVDELHFTLELALPLDGCRPLTRQILIRLTADFLVAFAPCVPRVGVNNVRLHPSSTLIQALWNAVEAELFMSTDDETKQEASARKSSVLVSAIKVAFQCSVTSWKWLLAQTLSCSQHHTCNASDGGKLVVKKLQDETDTVVADIFTQALCAAFERWRVSHEGVSQLHEYDTESQLYDAFNRLANFLAQSIPLHKGVNKNNQTGDGTKLVSAMLKASIAYVTEDLESRVLFFDALPPLVPKLDVDSITEIKAELNKVGEGLDLEDERWHSFFSLQSEMNKREEQITAQVNKNHPSRKDGVNDKTLKTQPEQKGDIVNKRDQLEGAENVQQREPKRHRTGMDERRNMDIEQHGVYEDDSAHAIANHGEVTHERSMALMEAETAEQSVLQPQIARDETTNNAREDEAAPAIKKHENAAVTILEQHQTAKATEHTASDEDGDDDEEDDDVASQPVVRRTMPHRSRPVV